MFYNYIANKSELSKKKKKISRQLNSLYSNTITEKRDVVKKKQHKVKQFIKLLLFFFVADF